MPGFTHDIVVNIIDRDESGQVFRKAATGDDGVDMEVLFKVIAERVKDKDHADSQGLFLGEDVLNDFGGGVKEQFLTFRVVDEERPKPVRDGQYDMPMVAVEEFFGHGMGPDVSMFFAATGAKFAFATKVDDFYCAAMGADVGGKAAVLGAAGKHFFGLFENMFRKPILVEFFKEDPIIVTSEDGFKGEFSVHHNRDYIKNVKS